LNDRIARKDLKINELKIKIKSMNQHKKKNGQTGDFFIKIANYQG